MTGLNIMDESHIHESILFGFPGRSNNATVINYCILYAKHYIYLEKLKGMEHVPNIFMLFDKYLFLEMINILI